MRVQGLGALASVAMVVTTLVAREVMACSGPGAAEAIGRSELVGWGLFVVTALTGLASLVIVFRRSGYVAGSIALGVLLVVHPGWWMSARSGDCGTTRLYASIAATVVGALLSGMLLRKSSQRK